MLGAAPPGAERGADHVIVQPDGACEEDDLVAWRERSHGGDRDAVEVGVHSREEPPRVGDDGHQFEEFVDRLRADRVPAAPGGVVTPIRVRQTIRVKSDRLVHGAAQARILTDVPIPRDLRRDITPLSPAGTAPERFLGAAQPRKRWLADDYRDRP
jgi:hypothetical protein